VKSKAEIMEYLKDSFARLHRAAAKVDEKNEVEPIRGTEGTWQRTRLGLLIDALAHSSDHWAKWWSISAGMELCRRRTPNNGHNGTKKI
jgi:hypothetical protein